MYVTWSYLTGASFWVLAVGILCVIGALVALALIQPWGRLLPRWLLLLFAWLGGGILTLHALYGFVVHGLAAAGVLTWTQVQQWAGAPVIPLSTEEVQQLIRASMLIWNPWLVV